VNELERLGPVDPPEPGVLDAAREVLWSVVAAEMLATAPPDAAQNTGESAAGRNPEETTRRIPEETARRPRPEDPGAR
jgi:hypothetical protein